MSNNYCYIYKVSFYNSTRCTISNNDMNFACEEHTYWAYKHQDARVHVIRCLKESSEWSKAMYNSELYINSDCVIPAGEGGGMGDNYCYIYKVSVYNSPRCTKSHSDMYFAREEHTRWAHKHQDARVHVIRCLETSPDWDSAMNNSELH